MKNLAIFAAIKEEFPFDKDFPVIYSGVGKINASISLSNYLNSNPDTDLIINVGSAGGLDCKPDSVIECGIFLDGQLNYPGYIQEHIVFGINKKTCITFDNFITEKPNVYGNCVDMEAVAFAKICMQKQVKFLCFKYISDIIGEEKQENKWLENYKNGSEILKQAIENII
jgi:adenosylhomocysteine nucleosidase